MKAFQHVLLYLMRRWTFNRLLRCPTLSPFILISTDSETDLWNKRVNYSSEKFTDSFTTLVMLRMTLALRCVSPSFWVKTWNFALRNERDSFQERYYNVSLSLSLALRSVVLLISFITWKDFLRENNDSERGKMN